MFRGSFFMNLNMLFSMLLSNVTRLIKGCWLMFENFIMSLESTEPFFMFLGNPPNFPGIIRLMCLGLDSLFLFSFCLKFIRSREVSSSFFVGNSPSIMSFDDSFGFSSFTVLGFLYISKTCWIL